MVYKFDPIEFDGTIFDLGDDSAMAKAWMQFYPQEAIPAPYFPATLTFDAATAKLPDMFHMSRGIFIFSERARSVMQHLAQSQVEFIPVTCRAHSKVAATLDFDSAYYFINVLGRAQRLNCPMAPRASSARFPCPRRNAGG